MSYTVPGRHCPVYVAGIKYQSIFEAALETGISQYWLNTSIKKKDGAPIIVKNQFVVTDFWVHQRAKEAEGL